MYGIRLQDNSAWQLFKTTSVKGLGKFRNKSSLCVPPSVHFLAYVPESLAVETAITCELQPSFSLGLLCGLLTRPLTFDEAS